MSKLPSSQELAVLVSNVTGTMFGTTFVSGEGEGEVRGESLCQQMVMMRLPADREITVALSSDEAGGRYLSAAFFGCPPEKVTRQMIDDVIAELLNMIAGQISTALDLEHLIGLPSRTTLADLFQTCGLGAQDPILLRSQADVDLGLWIFEAQPIGEEAAAVATGRGAFRSLIRKILGRRPALRSR
jgi:Chemotaxis phosphatase CheX